MKLRYLQLEKDSVFREDFESVHCIISILQGSAACKSHVNREYTLYERQMVFCPMSTSISCAFKEDSKIIVVSFNDETDPDSITFANTLLPTGGDTDEDSKPYILDIKPVLDVFFEFLSLIHHTPWSKDPIVLKTIMGGIFYLYSKVYSPMQNSLFFSSLICGDYTFKNRVLRHHLQAKNVRELADLCGSRTILSTVYF